MPWRPHQRAKRTGFRPVMDRLYSNPVAGLRPPSRASRRWPRARSAAEQLASALHVTLLAGEPGRPLAEGTTWGGQLESLSGHLGEFTATISGLRASASATTAKPAPARFDLVLDFGSEPAFAMRMP